MKSKLSPAMADPTADGKLSVPSGGRCANVEGPPTPNGDIDCSIGPEKCEMAVPVLTGLKLLAVSMERDTEGSMESVVGCSTEEPEE